MSSRPSSFKKPGGFLNGVDATIVGYTFEVGQTFPGKAGGESFTPLSFVPVFKVDGAEDTVDKAMLIDDADRFGGSVSEDGKTLITPDGQGIRQTSEAGLFLMSLCANGFNDALLSDSETEINYEPIIGWRVRLTQVDRVGKDGKVLTRVAKEGKFAGRVFNQTTTQVEKVYGPTAVTKAAGKANGKAKDQTIEEQAAEVLSAIVEEAGGSITRTKLQAKVALKVGSANPQKEAIKKLLRNPDVIVEALGLEYDGETISGESVPF